MTDTTDVDLDALLDRILERAAAWAGPVVNVTGEDISTLAVAGRVVVAAGDIVASAWGNQVWDQSVNAFTSAADRDAQWASPPGRRGLFHRRRGLPMAAPAGPVATGRRLRSGPGTDRHRLFVGVDAAGTTWIAKGGVAGGTWRRAAEYLWCSYTRAQAWTVAAGDHALGYDRKNVDDYALYNGSTGIMPIPLAGTWHWIQTIGAAAVAAGNSIAAMPTRDFGRTRIGHSESMATAAAPGTPPRPPDTATWPRPTRSIPR